MFHGLERQAQLWPLWLIDESNIADNRWNRVAMTDLCPDNIIMVFVDGLGLPGRDVACSPVNRDVCPCICKLLESHSVAIDTSLDVPGIPQSATGQASLLTGINAAKLVGRHEEGFPRRELRCLVEEHNIFKQLAVIGRSSTFANAYYVDSVDMVINSRRKSVTTVATLSAFGQVRGKGELMAGLAVYQDLTRDALFERGYAGPSVTPEEAGGHLHALSRDFDFTLFEYFQTDHVGHRGDAAAASQVLSRLDRFLNAVMQQIDVRKSLLLLTSDHGNIEDLSMQRHTSNPVPLIAIGAGAASLLDHAGSIVDVTPWIVEAMNGARG